MEAGGPLRFRNVTRREAQWRHFRNRVLLRFGFSFTDADHDKLLLDIVEGRAARLGAHERTERYRVELRGQVAIVVYCQTNDVFVTAYKPGSRNVTD